MFLRILTSRKQLLAALATALALLAASGALSYRNNAGLIRTSEWVAATHATIALQDELLARLNEAETGLFGFIITGESDFLDPFTAATNRIDQLLTQLKRAHADDPSQSARLARLEPLIQKRIAYVHHRAAVRQAEGLDAAVALVKRREAKQVMDAIRATIGEMKEAELRVLESRQRAAVASARRTLAFDMAFGVLSVVLLVLVFALLLAENARRQAGELSLQRARDELEIRVRERTAELAGANEALHTEVRERKQAEQKQAELARDLAEKNKDLEMLVYVASHDLRSPLVNIQGFSEELGRLCEELRSKSSGRVDWDRDTETCRHIVNEGIPEAVAFIRAAVVKMDRLLKGFLRFSRLGRAALNIRPLDTTALVRGIKEAMEYQLKAANATLRIEPLPSCLGDETQTGQVFSNVLDNALKYLDPSRPVRINVRGRVNDGMAVIAIEDNGVGIAESDRERVFEIFHRLNPFGVAGEGLGLTIARRILERQGGRIWLESEQGRGTTVYIALPAAPTGQPAMNEK